MMSACWSGAECSDPWMLRDHAETAVDHNAHDRMMLRYCLGTGHWYSIKHQA